MIGDASMTFIGSFGRNNQMQPALVTAVGVTNGNSPFHNVLDLNPSLGAANGGDIYMPPIVVFSIFQTLTSLNNGAMPTTVQFRLSQADDTNLTQNVQVLNQTDAIPFAMLTAGTRVQLRIGRNGGSLIPKRYFGAQIAIAGSALTNSTPQFLAQTMVDAHDMRLFNSGFSVA